jgi:hypothetical protein
MRKRSGFLMIKSGGVSAYVRLCRREQEYLYRLVERLSGET